MYGNCHVNFRHEQVPIKNFGDCSSDLPGHFRGTFSKYSNYQLNI